MATVWYPSLGEVRGAEDHDFGSPLSHDIIRGCILMMRINGYEAGREYLRDTCVKGRGNENW